MNDRDIILWLGEQDDETLEALATSIFMCYKLFGGGKRCTRAIKAHEFAKRILERRRAERQRFEELAIRRVPPTPTPTPTPPSVAVPPTPTPTPPTPPTPPSVPAEFKITHEYRAPYGVVVPPTPTPTPATRVDIAVTPQRPEEATVTVTTTVQRSKLREVVQIFRNALRKIFRL